MAVRRVSPSFSKNSTSSAKQTKLDRFSCLVRAGLRRRSGCRSFRGLHFRSLGVPRPAGPAFKRSVEMVLSGDLRAGAPLGNPGPRLMPRQFFPA
jgi:hypothetical protein